MERRGAWPPLDGALRIHPEADEVPIEEGIHGHHGVAYLQDVPDSHALEGGRRQHHRHGAGLVAHHDLPAAARAELGPQLRAVSEGDHGDDQVDALLPFLLGVVGRGDSPDPVGHAPARRLDQVDVQHLAICQGQERLFPLVLQLPRPEDQQLLRFGNPRLRCRSVLHVPDAGAPGHAASERAAVQPGESNDSGRLGDSLHEMVFRIPGTLAGRTAATAVRTALLAVSVRTCRPLAAVLSRLLPLALAPALATSDLLALPALIVGVRRYDLEAVGLACGDFGHCINRGGAVDHESCN
mmetsp:Transcript_101388/g.322089  ORF Transcript_101388/g.322089 Transcript_101388/m.322089 type:complete len:297 (-) Transcript_101388:28-918(-)